MKKACFVIIVLLMVFLFSLPAFSANGTWNNTGVTSPSWVNPDNWSSGTVPGATSGTSNTDIATFNTAVGANYYGTSGSPILTDFGRNIAGINFDTAAGNYFIGSVSLNPLLLTSGGTTQILGTLSATDAYETINAPLVIEGASGTYTLSNNSANGNGAGAGWLIIGGSISGGAAGSTVLTLNGSNTNANTISGVISNGSATTVAITKSGIGTWVLSGSNTFTGNIAVNAGTLEAGLMTQAFGIGSNVTVAGGGILDLGGFNETVGTLLGSGTVTSSAAGTPILTVSGDNTPTTFSGIIQNGIANSLGLTVGGSGSLTLSGANTYSGATTVNAGTLKAGVVNQAFGVGSAVVVGGVGILDLEGFNEAIGSLAGGGEVTNSGGLDVTLTTGWDNTSTTFSGKLQNGGTNNIALTKVGSGTLALTGDNTYTGITTLSGGILNLGSLTAIGPGTVFFNGGILQYSAVNHIDNSSQFSNASGQSFSIDTNGQNVTFNNALGSGTSDTLTKLGNGTLTLLASNSYSGITTISGGTLQVGNGGIIGSLGTGNVTDNANLTFDFSNNPTISNAISGTGSVTQKGTGTLILSGNNTYSGATTVNSGTLEAGIVTQAFGIGSAVSIGIGGTVDLAGLSETIGSLAGAGTVTSSAVGSITLTAGGDNSSTSYSGIIQDGSATSVGLSKAGGGILSLTGNNTYTGATTLNAGTLNLGSSGAIGPGTISFDGGILQYSSSNNTDYSGQFSSVGSQSFNVDTNGRAVSFANPLTSVGGTLTKIGNGTLTLLGNNNYSGITIISGGTLQIGSGGITGNLGGGSVTDNASLVFDLSNSPTVSNIISGTGSVTQSGTGTITVSGNNAYSGSTVINTGTLKAGAVNQAFGIGSAVSIGVGGTLDLGGFNETIGSLAGAGIVTSNGGGASTLTTGANNTSTIFSGNILNGSSAIGLTKIGSGTLTLSGNNTYSGSTILNAGTLSLGSGNAIGAGTIFFNSGTLQYSSGNNNDYSSQFSSGSNQAFNIDTNGQVVTFAHPFTSAGGELTKTGNGTLILSSANNYTGSTLINGGTLQVGNPNALGTGPVTNNSTLALGTTSLSLGGLYTQNSSSALNLSIYSTSSYGNIITPSASVSAGSAINIHITGFIQNNAQYEIINSGGAGIGSVPSTITSDNGLFSFTGSILNGNLYLTANNILISLADNPNTQAIATVLSNETNPSSDLQSALSSLVHLSDAQISSALNTLGPIVNRGVVENNDAALNNFMGASLERVQNVLSRKDIINSSLDKVELSVNQSESGNSTASGVSSGDASVVNGIWAKPYGSYLTQQTSQNIVGYNAWNAGTVVGVDRLFGDNFTLGVSAGYAYGQVNSNEGVGSTDITSAQSTLYGGYQDSSHNFFIDAAGSLAWNWYDGKRNISYISRTADSSYDGQQYSAYLESGYRFNTGSNSESALLLGNNVDITPLVSLQWTHLTLGGYTESNAGALDLNVNKQNYDTLESGLGLSMSIAQINDWGIFTPEIHAKWLHDYIEDKMVVTSSFTGGGGSFTSNGLTPDKDGLGLGSKFSFDLKNDLSLIAEFNVELRQGFVGTYGSGTLHYKF